LANWARAASPAPGSLHHDDLLFQLHRDQVPDPHDLDPSELLELVDALLCLRSGRWKRYLRATPSNDQLRRLLLDGGTAWTLTQHEDGLERRVDPTAAAAVAATVEGAATAASTSPAAQAGDHLARAWDAAYGADPDADRAYDEAVLAVEALACPLVCPANMSRTLGTVIRDLRNQSAKWELGIGGTTGELIGPGRMVEMLALVWEGQSRHAGAPNSRLQTQAEAEAVVHLAATLVHWLMAGVLRRKA
jgi:hypothetical protein